MAEIPEEAVQAAERADTDDGGWGPRAVRANALNLAVGVANSLFLRRAAGMNELMQMADRFATYIETGQIIPFPEGEASDE